VHGKLTNPILSSLAKKLVDICGDSRQQQWFNQHLFLAGPVVRRNASRIFKLVCVQVWSDFSHSQYANLYYCPPLAFVLMHGYGFPHVYLFCESFVFASFTVV